MRKPPFLEELERRVLVCDGAMGTMLYARGVFLNRSFDELNLTQPDLVAEVHQAYVRAGADVIETNTFGANRIKLSTFGLADRTAEINVQGARHRPRRRARAGLRGRGDRAARRPDRAVGQDRRGRGASRISPSRRRRSSRAASTCSCSRRSAISTRLAPRFARSGACARCRSSRRSRPKTTANTLDGVAPELFVPQLERQGADVVGLNCSVGPAAMLETIERMARVATVRLSAQPNAGRPREVEGRNIYLCSPEYMASYARRFINSGVRLVGGCCGTTPGSHPPDPRRRPRRRSGRGPAFDGCRRRIGERRRRRCRSRSWRARTSRAWRTRWRAARSWSAWSCCRRADIGPTS